jgi:hypothetical protein
MAAASIILRRKRGDKLKEKAAETGYLPDELGAELLCKCLNEELDPEDLVEQYKTLSNKYIAQEFL